PDSTFAAFHLLTPGSSPWADQVSQALLNLDTGITGLEMQEMKLDDLQLSSEVMTQLEESLSQQKTVLMSNQRSQRVCVSLGNDGRLVAGRLVARHNRSDGSEMIFEISEESDGSQRLIDLLQAFCDLSNEASQSIYVIDELDRSLHTLLTRQLLEGYLASCSPQSRSQLIFSTHDLLLMDQSLLRRDEMWVVERSHNGNSNLFSFSEYAEMRYDKDIQRSYLEGRLGGIPQLLIPS
ncbi:MAG: AAA family ATPase, partial [Cyanobium sp.]